VGREGRAGEGGEGKEEGRGGKSDELFCVSDVGEAEGRKEDVVGVVSTWLGRKIMVKRRRTEELLGR